MYSLFHKIAPLLAAALALTGCQKGDGRPVTPPGQMTQGVRLSGLQPGKPVPFQPANNPYEGQDEPIAEGKKLYNQYNCSGCHFAGGGGIGPALMDDEWLYGSTSEHIFWSVVQGRPNGMPAFGGRIVDDQVWKIAAYVRSLSELDQKDKKEPQQVAVKK